MVYRWIVLLHVVGVLLFMLAHGVSASVAFRLRRERNVERVGTLLDVSAASFDAMFLGFLWVLATGIALGVLGGWWTTGWFWTSLVLWFVLMVAMLPAVSAYSKVREALGLYSPHERRKLPAPSTPPSAQDIDAMLASAHPVPVAAIGIVGILVLLWLMMFKPF